MTTLIDNVHNRLIFYLSKSRQKKEFLGKNFSKVVKFHNLVLIIVLRAEIVTIFAPKVVTMGKFANFVRLLFCTHYSIFQTNFGILQLLKGSFWEFGLF